MKEFEGIGEVREGQWHSVASADIKRLQRAEVALQFLMFSASCRIDRTQCFRESGPIEQASMSSHTARPIHRTARARIAIPMNVALLYAHRPSDDVARIHWESGRLASVTRHLPLEKSSRSFRPLFGVSRGHQHCPSADRAINVEWDEA